MIYHTQAHTHTRTRTHTRTHTPSHGQTCQTGTPRHARPYRYCGDHSMTGTAQCHRVDTLVQGAPRPRWKSLGRCNDGTTKAYGQSYIHTSISSLLLSSLLTCDGSGGDPTPVGDTGRNPTPRTKPSPSRPAGEVVPSRQTWWLGAAQPFPCLRRRKDSPSSALKKLVSYVARCCDRSVQCVCVCVCMCVCVCVCARARARVGCVLGVGGGT